MPLRQFPPLAHGDSLSYRVAYPQLPHVPDAFVEEVLLANAHSWNHVVERIGDFPIEEVAFQRETWSLERVLALEPIGTAADAIDDHAGYFVACCEQDTSYLFRNPARLPSQRVLEHVKQHGTWPTPIHVWSRGKGADLLLEGHHRLGYLAGLARCKVDEPRREHEVWVARPKTIRGD